MAAVLARPRPDVDHPVGGPDGVLVVLDHDQRVAQVAQPEQGLQQPVVVPLVQADRRLVQHVQHADQPGADLGGQPDPLRLAAGQRRRRPVQRQVVQADVEQEAEPGVDLLEHPPGDLLSRSDSSSASSSLASSPIGSAAVVGDRPAVHRDGQRHRLEPGAVAGRAGHLAHELGEPLPAGVALGLGVPPLDVGDRALEVGVVRPLPAVPVLVPDVHLVVVAVQQRLAGRGRQPGPRRVDAEPERVAERLDQPHEVVADVPAAPGADRAVGQRPGRVGDDQLRVDLHLGAEAGAVRAGAPGRVERERPRLELVERQVVVQAGQVLGVHPLAVRVVVRQVDEVQHDHAAGQRRARSPPSRSAAAGPTPSPSSRSTTTSIVCFSYFFSAGSSPGHRRVQPDRSCRRPGPGSSPWSAGRAAARCTRPCGPRTTGASTWNLVPSVKLEHPVHDLLRGLPGDRAAAHRAVRLAHPGEQQPQVVVDLGDRADGRPRVAAGGLLVDRHRRRQAVDEVHVGLVHLAEELPGVRRQRLDVPALALGEDRVEGQARLARPGQPGEDDHGVPAAGRARHPSGCARGHRGRQDDLPLCAQFSRCVTAAGGARPPAWYPGGLTKRGLARAHCHPPGSVPTNTWPRRQRFPVAAIGREPQARLTRPTPVLASPAAVMRPAAEDAATADPCRSGS